MHRGRFQLTSFASRAQNTPCLPAPPNSSDRQVARPAAAAALHHTWHYSLLSREQIASSRAPARTSPRATRASASSRCTAMWASRAQAASPEVSPRPAPHNRAATRLAYWRVTLTWLAGEARSSEYSARALQPVVYLCTPASFPSRPHETRAADFTCASFHPGCQSHGALSRSERAAVRELREPVAVVHP